MSNLIHKVRNFFRTGEPLPSKRDAQKLHNSVSSELIYAELYDGAGSERFREYPWPPHLMG
jgi:hypothetical protein